MKNQNLVRGLFLMVIALGFGVVSYRYKLGELSQSGPGLFPLMVSCMLFVIGVFSAVRARLVDPEPMSYNFKNIGIILASLVGFALLSHFLNMVVGIVYLVFCSTLAGTSYSVARNIKISIGLIAIAFAFKHLLGLNLPLI